MDTDLRETMRRTIIMKKENSIPVRNSLLLLLTATIWGVAFVAQSVSMDYIGGFTFNAVRNLIGALTLLPVIKVLDKTRSEAEKKCESSASGRKTLLIGGICCGIMLCLAGNFQQFGIKYTTVGKAGSDHRYFPEKEMQPLYLDCSPASSVWTLSPVSDTRRGTCSRQR